MRWSHARLLSTRLLVRRLLPDRRQRRRAFLAATCAITLVIALLAGHVLRTIAAVGDSLPLQQVRLELELGAYLHGLDRLHDALTPAIGGDGSRFDIQAVALAGADLSDDYREVLELAEATGSYRLVLLHEQISALIDDTYRLVATGQPADPDGLRNLLERIGAIHKAVSSIHRDTNLIALGTLERQQELLASLEVWIVISLVLLLAAVLGVLAMLRRSHRDEERLRASREASIAANAAKTRFLASMSHELRTPLNAIIGFSEAMQMKLFGPLGDARYGDYVDHIQASGRHLLSLINDVLDLSKIEAGKLELQSEPVDLPRLIDDVVTLMSGRAQGAGIVLQAVLPDRVPTLHADPRAMRQILLNLLANAIRFTPAGGSVSIAARPAAAGGFSLAVRDTGSGIALEDQDRVLRPFEQVDNRLGKAQGGTGLGLPICAQLAELHGGYLELDSAPGSGTTVTVTLPSERVMRAANDTAGPVLSGATSL